MEYKIKIQLILVILAGHLSPSKHMSFIQLGAGLYPGCGFTFPTSMF